MNVKFWKTVNWHQIGLYLRVSHIYFWYIFGNRIYGNVFSKICVEIKHYTNFQGNAQYTGDCPCMTSMTSPFWPPPLFIRCFNSVPIVWNQIWLKPKNGRSLYHSSLTTFENSIENWFIISRYLSLFELKKATKTVKTKYSMPNSPCQDNGTLGTVKNGLVTILLNISNKLT